MEDQARRPPWPRRVGRRALHELRSLLPAWLYFFLTIMLLRVTEAVILREHGLAPTASRVVLVSAIVAKSILTVDLIPFMKRLERRPALAAAAARTLAYVLLVTVFTYVEVLFDFRQQGLAEGTRAFAERLASPRFWVAQVWLAILLMVYGLARTCVRRFGLQRVRGFLLGHG